MIIKVCGLTEKANILAIDALSIDLIGMIFYEKSARFVERFVEKKYKSYCGYSCHECAKSGRFCE